MHVDFSDADKAVLGPRFEALTERGVSHWLWKGYVGERRYGIFRVAKGRSIQAHRMAWILYRGPIEGGCQLHHICGVKTCVNPWHLELVTPDDHQEIHHERERIAVCRNGHPFEGDNIGWRTNSSTGYTERYCRQCQRDNARRHYWRNADRLRAAARARYQPR